MKKILIIGLWIFATACSKKDSPKPPEVVEKISASAGSVSNVPVLKGILLNPFLRISVQYLSGKTDKQFRKVKCNVNAAGLSDIKTRRKRE